MPYKGIWRAVEYFFTLRKSYETEINEKKRTKVIFEGNYNVEKS